MSGTKSTKLELLCAIEPKSSKERILNCCWRKAYEIFIFLIEEENENHGKFIVTYCLLQMTGYSFFVYYLFLCSGSVSSMMMMERRILHHYSSKGQMFLCRLVKIIASRNLFSSPPFQTIPFLYSSCFTFL